MELGVRIQNLASTSDSPLLASCSPRVKLRRPYRRVQLPASGFAEPAEETDKVPFTFVLAGRGRVSFSTSAGY
jgi:hypothetical protein